MMRSLYTGVSGLTNHQTRMDVLSNNIANVNTVGFKPSRTMFSDALSQTIQGATPPRADLGGINAKQIGLGMKVSSIDILFNKSSFQTTNVNTDLAINNNGFFIVQSGAQQYYTRAGNFYFDRDGNFLTNEGLHVMGWMADPVNGTINNSTPLGYIQVPVTKTMEPKISTNIAYVGNLKADALLGEAQSTATDIYDAEGRAYRTMTMYTKVGDNLWLAYTSINGADRLNPPGTVPLDGIDGNVKLVEFDGDGKFLRVNDLDMTAGVGQADEFGNFNGTTPIAGASPFSGTPITLAADAMSATKAEGVITFVDANGVVRAIGMTATCTQGESAPGLNDAEWTIQFMEGNRIVGAGTYAGAGGTLPGITLVDGSTFDLSTAGTTVDVTGSATNLQAPIPTAAGTNNPMQFMPAGSSNNMPTDIRLTYDRDSFTQFAGGFNLGSPRQDGYPAGDLFDRVINSAGIIVGYFSNGQQLNLAQIATCIFNNQQGLERAGSTLFTKSNNSGDPIIGEAGSGGRGTMQAGVLEMAAVDLAEEFTNMIVTQRGYQSNSRIITTSDEMLQELLSLKR